MKIHYINILLFALALNILEHNQRNHKNPTPHTPKIPTTRLLCECELYEPVNYNSDRVMKKVMEIFNKQTQERFHEYDDRMAEKRMQCKDQCDKEIQKIILKDKLEKELMDKFATLQTDIQNDAIPTCVCEKSIADKMEKECLRCAQNLGGIVAPSSGVLGGIGEAAISLLKPAAITAAEKAAVTEATALATQAGMNAVRFEIQGLSNIYSLDEGFVDLSSIVSKLTYNNRDALIQSAKNVIGNACNVPGTNRTTIFYNSVIKYGGEKTFDPIVEAGRSAFEKTLASQKELLKTAKVGAVEATYGGYHISIIASIVAIVVIVLIMIIIYLILRYRRKKKMKKKLQYIKLLEE
ncbi:surface antigen [Plasmodium falciparum UGT5.1]|uniref:Surface antigen n=1 Tax=Plasmodium falciparum UGT5.1 TaxID=1237627 RepID=W7J3D2_PLAFA|nr:surface antigen [Plasmodium falciparum UGT5.1]